MSGNTKFLIDANILIQAHRQYYAFAICPGFWDALVHHHRQTRVYSIDRVREELTGNDELVGWIRSTMPKSLFRPTNETGVTGTYAEIMQWISSNRQFTEAAKEEFAKVADGWIVAFAKVNRYTVVTHEEFRPEVKARIPMPNICREFKVETLNTFDMLKALNTKFHWNHP